MMPELSGVQIAGTLTLTRPFFGMALALKKRKLRNYSDFVLGSAVARSPSFHLPLSRKMSMRSKRFRTFRFAIILLANLRLGCCDISPLSGGISRVLQKTGRLQTGRHFSISRRTFYHNLKQSQPIKGVFAISAASLQPRDTRACSRGYMWFPHIFVAASASS